MLQHAPNKKTVEISNLASVCHSSAGIVTGLAIAFRLDRIDAITTDTLCPQQFAQELSLKCDTTQQAVAFCGFLCEPDSSID